MRLYDHARPLVRALALAAAAALWAAPAPAQTVFAWPDTAVDIAAYTTLEECQAAIDRSMRFTKATETVRTGVWSDTIPLDTTWLNGPEPLPGPVVQTARRCGIRFANADSVSVTDFNVLVPLYLQARWDDRARTLIERRLAAVEPKKYAERAEVVDTALNMLFSFGWQVGERRGEMAEEVGLTHIPRIGDRVKRLRLYSRLSLTASSGKDLDSARARVQRVVERMAPLVDSLTQKEFDELVGELGSFGAGIEEGGDFVQRYYAMLNYSLGKRAFLDSLRKSTEAYVRIRKDNWSRATGLRGETYQLGNPLGEQAPPIEADLWLGYDSTKGPRPAPGRVSLVVFVSASSCIRTGTDPEGLGGACARNLYPLRRLEERFPELDVTVVTQTSGHYAYLKEGMTPEKEARLAKQWLEGLGVEAPLAVTSSEFWRLPDPDTRRVSRASENTVNYTFGKSGSSGAYLIDGDGIVVHARDMNRWAVYEDYEELIEILLQRQRESREIVP